MPVDRGMCEADVTSLLRLSAWPGTFCSRRPDAISVVAFRNDEEESGPVTARLPNAVEPR